MFHKHIYNLKIKSHCMHFKLDKMEVSCTLTRITKRIKQSKVGREGKKMGRKDRKRDRWPISFKVPDPINTLTACSLWSLHFLWNARFTLSAIQFKRPSQSQASFPLSNHTTGWEQYQQQQVSGSMPAALLLINLFYIAFSTARKLPLIINRNAEATRGNQSQSTAAALITPGSYQSGPELSCAHTMLEAAGSAWEGT